MATIPVRNLSELRKFLVDQLANSNTNDDLPLGGKNLREIELEVSGHVPFLSYVLVFLPVIPGLLLFLLQHSILEFFHHAFSKASMDDILIILIFSIILNLVGGISCFYAAYKGLKAYRRELFDYDKIPFNRYLREKATDFLRPYGQKAFDYFEGKRTMRRKKVIKGWALILVGCCLLTIWVFLFLYKPTINHEYGSLIMILTVFSFLIGNRYLSAD